MIIVISFPIRIWSSQKQRNIGCLFNICRPRYFFFVSFGSQFWKKLTGLNLRLFTMFLTFWLLKSGYFLTRLFHCNFRHSLYVIWRVFSSYFYQEFGQKEFWFQCLHTPPSKPNAQKRSFLYCSPKTRSIRSIFHDNLYKK